MKTVLSKIFKNNDLNKNTNMEFTCARISSLDTKKLSVGDCSLRFIYTCHREFFSDVSKISSISLLIMVDEEQSKSIKHAQYKHMHVKITLDWHIYFYCA